MAPEVTTTDPILPFGKHKDKHASDVDAHYLDWMIGLENLREPFKSQLLAHLETRADWKRLGDED